MAATLLLATLAAPVASFAQTQTDPRMFAQTGFRIDRDSFFDYFGHRGGVATFGYPVSRDFQFEGCTSQFFQRLVMQQCGTQGVGTMNLLDEGLLPYTRMNGSTFPASDTTLTLTAPKPSDANYASAILDFVRQNAVDSFDGQPVNFLSTFFNTITPDVAGTSDANILGLLDLEMWGAPTSKPAYDPSNHNFIYQRFQRGIMHYDRTCGCTQGLLLADYLKALLTGDNLPGRSGRASEDQRALAGRGDWRPSAGRDRVRQRVRAGCRQRQRQRASDPTLLPLKTPGKPNAPPPPVSSPDYGLSMFLWGQPGDHRSRSQDCHQRQLPLAENALPVERHGGQGQGRLRLD